MSIAKKLTQIAQNQPELYAAGLAAGQALGGYDKGFQAGIQAEHDRFWDTYIASANGYYVNAFSSYGWTDKTYHPNQTIICTSGAKEMFNSAKITSTRVAIELRCADASYMFTGCNNLKTIPYLGFFGVTSTSSMFVACSQLENITVDGSVQSSITLNASSKLTDASVQSIIDHLKDLTGEKTQTLTFHANVGARLTDAQKAAITAKNWTLAY